MNKMYALYYTDPYDGDWARWFFEEEADAILAKQIIEEYDDHFHPNLPREERDWGYLVREIKPTTLEQIKELYPIHEENSYGGDNCFIGRSVSVNNGDYPDTLDHGINVLTNS